MKAFSRTLGVVVAGLLLSAGPLLAQGRPAESGGGGGADRGAGSGAGGNASGAGGGGGGGNIAAGGGGSVSSGGGDSGGGGFSAPSMSSMSAPSVSMGSRAFRATAPEHRVSYSESASPRAIDGQRARPRSSGSSSSGSSSAGSSSSPGRSAGAADRSTPRSESAPADRAVTRGSAANGSTSRRAGEGAAPNNASGAAEVPNWSRPRGNRPATDTAVPRVGPRPDRNAGERSREGTYYYDPYYYGGFGYGFGYGYYDQGYYGYPFYSPFGMGYGIPYGYFDPFYGDPYEYGGGYGAYSSRVYGGHDQGNLKLKVKPRNAKVYVDGYYVGVIDEFDGAFQKLTLNGGRHKVELRAEGYETAEFDVLITPEQTVTFAGDMKKVQ
jgi:hypothetical protein